MPTREQSRKARADAREVILAHLRRYPRLQAPAGRIARGAGLPRGNRRMLMDVMDGLLSDGLVVCTVSQRNSAQVTFLYQLAGGAA